jgi:colanic acid/amylovoran biosynthesis glycosyltransferase
VPLILAVGRFVEKKGFNQLIEACARLKLAGVRFRCLIVGEHGPAHEEIVRLMQACGLGAQVELRGAVPQDALARHLSRARTSLHCPAR